MTRLGYQIPNFTYPNTPEAGIFDSVIAQAKAAEAAGFDNVVDELSPGKRPTPFAIDQVLPATPTPFHCDLGYRTTP